MRIITFHFKNATVQADPKFHLSLLFGQSHIAGGCKVGVNATDCDTSSTGAQHVNRLYIYGKQPAIGIYSDAGEYGIQETAFNSIKFQENAVMCLKQTRHRAGYIL